MVLGDSQSFQCSVPVVLVQYSVLLRSSSNTTWAQEWSPAALQRWLEAMMLFYAQNLGSKEDETITFNIQGRVWQGRGKE
jgi:hypothetical protein